MTVETGTLIRIVYFSRNRVALSEQEMAWEIDRILAVAQTNNARDGITGALAYNDGVFGQVLEGPAGAIEDTFDRIQMDDRHADVTLLEIGPITERTFIDWSMGFVGQNDLSAGPGGSVSTFDLSHLTGPEIYGVLHSLMLRNEVRARAA